MGMDLGSIELFMLDSWNKIYVVKSKFEQALVLDKSLIIKLI